ncbi:MFS transporter [Caballeronia mineralivorans]|nr:MFS transporter [Caballeronia mineralivorans]
MSLNEKMDLEALIDSKPISRFQILVIGLCALVAMMDGFDMQSIAFVAPEIVGAWKIAPAVIGLVFGAGLLGGLIGAVIFGRIGDSKGRKPTLLCAILLVAIGSFATPFSSSITTLIVALFFTGIGLGGAMPNFIALASEYSPSRRRATLVALMFCGFPLGAVIGGLVSARLIPLFGWTSVFVAGGVFSLLILPLVATRIPESARFLGLRNDRMKVLPIVTRMGYADTWNGDVGAAARGHSSVARLLADGRAPGTILLWIISFLSMFMLYMLINWIPMMARRSGLGIESAVVAVSMLNLGGIIGSVTLGRLSDSTRSPAIVLGGSYMVGAAMIALIGHAVHSGLALCSVAFLAGCFSMGAQLCTVALCANFYDTFLRATGIGCSMAAGRIGAIVGPVFGGMLLAAGTGAPSLFAMAGVTSLGAGAAVLTMGLLVMRPREHASKRTGANTVAREST